MCLAKILRARERGNSEESGLLYGLPVCRRSSGSSRGESTEASPATGTIDDGDDVPKITDAIRVFTWLCLGRETLVPPSPRVDVHEQR